MNQTDRRKYLIKALLSEQQRYKGVEISENVLEQKTLLRSLMNVRMAAPISAEFEKIQDCYLQEVNAEKGHEKLLASCYENCLSIADENGVKSIAFCCISTGVFMFPNENAAQIADKT